MIRSSLGSEKARADLIVRPAPRRLAYDWRQLQRLNISAALTPAAAEILYRPPSVWQEHRETF
jgi:hypothetical protein